LTVSSRTPEGVPNRCPLCGARVCIEPSQPPGDAPCPRCGHLLWFLCDKLGVTADQVDRSTSLEADSLDVTELIMELEEEFGVTIPDDEVESIKTVGDAIDVIERLTQDRP
jgi:acyl carrier protein